MEAKLIPEVKELVNNNACDCGGSKCWPEEQTEEFALKVQKLVASKCAEIALNEPRVWDTNAPDPQHRISAAIRSTFGLEEPLGLSSRSSVEK